LNNKTKGKYYFLTTSSECYTVLYTFCFAYSMLSVIDELCCVRRFHFILLVIRVDSGSVLVMDSLRKDPKMWADLRDMLQR
jgi:hypothetical protein